MSSKAAITVNRPRDEVERLWASSEYRPDYAVDAAGAVTFKDAPGDRGTEIHVDLGPEPEGVGGVVQKVTAPVRLAKAKDELRRFKQQVETGEIARSEASPEGELLERKLKQRPAQPLSESELHKVGV